ncbi:MAG: OmpA family protein [Schleiferiaceae bacterium]|nr:OmpA family protein [Schleiferiaceae bacterium]
MRKLLLLLLTFLSVSLSAQLGEVVLGNYCGDDHASPSRQIQKGLQALNKGDYPNAGVYIGAALRQNEADQHALYLRGEWAMRTGKFPIAEGSWKRLTKRCPGYKPDLLFFIATLAIEAGRPEEAERYLEQWFLRRDRELGYEKEAENMLAELNLKETFLANPVPFNPQPARNLNTRWDEYLAALTPDGSSIYFTRRSKKKNKYDGPGAQLRSVEEFSSAVSTGEHQGMPAFEEGTALEAPFNTQYNEGGPSITADNRFMVFTICERNPKTGAQNCDLYYTTYEYGVWNGIRPMPEGINRPESWESQPSISPNGDILYFTSDRKGGYGGLDLYRSTKDANGNWGVPENLGAAVNTKKNEKSPFIHPDSESLYFASDGHPGMGGYDLFKIQIAQGSAQWGKPMNLGYPINTGSDEIGMMVTLDGQKAYFASNKINQSNGWDIYFFDLYEAVQPEEVVLVRGQLKIDQFASDEDPKVLLKNSVTGESQQLQLSHDDNSFTAVVKKEEAQQVLVQVEAKKAAFSAAPLRLSPNFEDEGLHKNEVYIDLEHKDLESGEAYPIPHILFETASDRLDAQSELLIASFAEYLLVAPSLSVQIQGHTDNVGDAGANLDLSQRRAKRVAQTIIDLGVSSSRITYRGYGEKRPVASNDSEAGRAQNRRTVFVVTAL